MTATIDGVPVLTEEPAEPFRIVTADQYQRGYVTEAHEHRPFFLLGVTASGAYVVRDPKAVGK